VTANALAWIVLGAWPVVVLAVFAARRAAPLARTTAWMMLLPVMFLPSGVTFGGPAAINKDRVVFLSIWIALQAFHKADLAAQAPPRTFPRAIFGVLALGSVLTVLTNGDVLTFGPRSLAGLVATDAASMIVRLGLGVYLPFLVGQQVFRTERDLRDLLDVLTKCGLLYLPFCLVELRLSPQFHHWVYGFTPGTFVEALRGSGYRPIVFMDNGLAVAMFSFTTFAAAIGLARSRAAVGAPSARTRTLVTGALVLLCKSLAAILYAAAAAVLRFLSFANVGRAAAAIVVLVLVFPLLRIADLTPTERVVEAFERFEPARAASLAYRFRNEDALVVRALERPVFGWGYSARAWVYGADGSTTTVTDGLWIIFFGNSGFVGLFGFFALIAVPVFRMVANRRRMPPSAQALTSTLALIVAVYGFDSLPNSMFDFLPLAYAGALHTVAARLARPARAARARVVAVTAPPEVVAG
jgi:hypothetical protein